MLGIGEEGPEGVIRLRRHRHGRQKARLSLADEQERAAKVALMQEAVARAWNIPVKELRARTRKKAPVARARQVAMYLTHVSFGLSLSAVGKHFGRDRTTAAHACRQIEDLRDNQDFDLMLDRLECAVSYRGYGQVRQ